MNWFHDLFVKMIDNQTGLYQMGFFTDTLLYIAVLLSVVGIVSGKMTIKHYLLSVVGGLLIFILDKSVHLPLYDVFENPRIKSLTMNTLLYVAGLLVGLAGMATLVFFKKRRSLEAIIFTTSLVVMSILVYSYHLLILNAGLKVAVENNESFYVKIISGDDHVFNFFCKDEKLKCYSGNISEFHNNFDELPSDFVGAYKEVSAEREDPVFRLSNVATTAEVKYTSVFAKRGDYYRLIMDKDKSVRLFYSQKMQFMTLANSAILFWTIIPILVVCVHRKKFFKSKRKVSPQ